jgi:curved DNA-binding protein CbpA
VKAGVSDEELRSAYRRLVRLHHPDHNGGSRESTVRFEEIQEAYAYIREQRKHAPPPRRPPPTDRATDERLADIERELREAQRAREAAERAERQARIARDQARRDARDAAREHDGRASDEDLGYVNTDDSFSKIVSDVWDELTDRFAEARGHPAVKRVEDLIDELQGRRRPQD